MVEAEARPWTEEFARRCEVVYLRAVRALAARGPGAAPAVDAVPERIASAEAELAQRVGGLAPMARPAGLFQLDEVRVAFVWAAAAASADPRLPLACDALGGASGRGGLNAVAFATLYQLDAVAAHDLTAWLDDPRNPMIARGLLAALDDAAPPASRPFTVPGRMLAYLRGDDHPAPPVTPLRVPRSAQFDDPQRAVLAQLERVLRDPTDLVVVIEGAIGSGRRTAIAQVAAGRPLVAIDATSVDRRQLKSALLALRRESFLTDALPVIADVDAWQSSEPGADRISELARTLDGWDIPVVVTTSVSGLDLGTRHPTVRVRWPVAGAPLRRSFWAAVGATGGEPPPGDLDGLAHRYRVGPGGIARASATARTLLEADERLDAAKLALGLRHNIAERLGGLARRVEPTQTWDDLVIADDMRDQLQALIARVRHAPQVLQRWGYQEKMARGTGVAALFSGPPGTGKSMCAGLIARELDLETYQVDLSQVVSKWVGETEKQLARVFDAAEEGHALLLFDEADSLFGQRSTEVKGAVDRYANLEVNFLLQRIEAFGGITVLTTNLDTAIDRALRRRLAAHIVFDAPDEDERATLWERLTRTGSAPLARDVDPGALARAYPTMTGANIRNAALGAAFFAAAAGNRTIGQETLHRAARVEYRAMGHVLSERSTISRSR